MNPETRQKATNRWFNSAPRNVYNHMDEGDAFLNEAIEAAIRNTEGWRKGFAEGWRKGFKMAASLMLGLLFVIVMILTSACGMTPEGSLIRDTVNVKGAKAYDEGLANVNWFLCNGASIGSVRRWMGNDIEKAKAWSVICADGNASVLTQGLVNAAAP